MLPDEGEVNAARRIAKPIGVYIITASDFLMLGLIPLLSTVWLGRSTEFDIPLVSLVLAISLALLVMAGSLWAWVGDSPGRRLLLSSVTATCLVMLANGVTLALSSEVAGHEKLPSINLIWRGVFWLGVNWWYFTRPNVTAYYRQNTWN